MAARRSVSPIIKNQTNSPDRSTPKNATKANFRAQTARSSAIPPSTIPWRTSGIWRPPPFHLHLPYEERKPQPVPKVKTWCPPGRYIDERPLESRIALGIYEEPKPEPEPSWKPSPGTSGRPLWQTPKKIEHKRYSYYDAATIRRSLDELLKTMPGFKLKPINKESPWVAINQAKDDA